MRIRNQSVKKGYNKLTNNVTRLLKRVDVYTGKIKTNKNGNPLNFFTYNPNNLNLNFGKRKPKASRRKGNVSL